MNYADAQPFGTPRAFGIPERYAEKIRPKVHLSLSKWIKGRPPSPDRANALPPHAWGENAGLSAMAIDVCSAFCSKEKDVMKRSKYSKNKRFQD